MPNDRLTTTLIILWVIAIVLGVIALVVVFYPTGSYQPVIVQGPGTTTSFGNLATSTASSSLSGAATTTPVTLPPGTYQSNYTTPYPVTWTEGHENFSVTGATFANGMLTFSFAIQMGSASECVPLNIRLITDELGTQETPNSPAGSSFTFPDTGTCNGTPAETYSQTVSFLVSPSLASPLLFTTGGTSNVFFSVATNTTNGIDITLPGTSG